METTSMSSETITVTGIYHPVGYPSWYYIGEWTVNNDYLQFNGILARANYNGMAARSFSFTPAKYKMYDIQLSDIKKIDPYKFKYVKRELNTLFDNCRHWIDLVPETDAIKEDCELRSPGVIYNEGTIFLSEELRWKYDGTIIGSYYSSQHMSYYQYDRQEPYYLVQEKDYKDFPAINSFNGFSSLEFTRLHNFSNVKKISKSTYELIINAVENGMHWVYRSIQAANNDIIIN